MITLSCSQGSRGARAVDASRPTAQASVGGEYAWRNDAILRLVHGKERQRAANSGNRGVSAVSGFSTSASSLDASSKAIYAV